MDFELKLKKRKKKRKEKEKDIRNSEELLKLTVTWLIR